MKKIAFILLLSCLTVTIKAQNSASKANDLNTPLHLIQPDYPVPYGTPKVEKITADIDKIYNYLNAVTPYQLENAKTGETLSDYAKMDLNTVPKSGDFRLVSYEWGIVYGAMLYASEILKDEKYKMYTESRFNFLGELTPYLKNATGVKEDWGAMGPIKGLYNPGKLDDCGAMCAALIKAKRAGLKADLQPIIAIDINYILNKEHRLADGTFARNRPQKNTLWLDDLYMSVPAIAQMGKMTGEKKYYDEAVKQLLSFAKKMFNPQKGVYMHGWVEAMPEHPEFNWARANGWALLTTVELLDVLPINHPGRPAVLKLLRQHAFGLASFQSGKGFWHQLLNCNDSYLETSATAIYTYCFARAINNGWLDKMAYTPKAILGWNAVSTKITDAGQIDGTCVGTGMAFDPMFYYYRPTSAYAAHGYGPTLLAGIEMIKLLNNNSFGINDSSMQIKMK